MLTELDGKKRETTRSKVETKSGNVPDLGRDIGMCIAMENHVHHIAKVTIQLNDRIDDIQAHKGR